MDNLEWKTRVDLAAAFRLVDLYGWSDMLATHLSARIPGPSDHFLINPMGVLFEEMTASDLIKLNIDGNILQIRLRIFSVNFFAAFTNKSSS